MDSENIGQGFERRLEFQTAAQTAFVRGDARKTLRMAQYARSRVLRNPTVGHLVRCFRRSKGGVGDGRDRGLGGKMILLGPARVLAVEQPTEEESQVAAVVRLAHGGSLTRAAPEHLVDCSPLDTTLFEAANPHAALPGASWLRDLRNLRRTEYADLGSFPTESERLDAWQDPDGREQQQCGHLVPPPPDPDVVPALPNPESQFPLHPLRIPVSFAHRVSVENPRLRDSSGRFLPRSDSHQSTHEESADSPRMHNEPGPSSHDGLPINVDAPDHAVIPSDVEIPAESLRLERMTKIPVVNVYQNSVPKKIRLLNQSCSRPNLLSHS